MQKRKNEERGYQLMAARDTVKHLGEIKIYICVKAVESNKRNVTELLSSLRIHKPGSKVIAHMLNPI